MGHVCRSSVGGTSTALHSLHDPVEGTPRCLGSLLLHHWGQHPLAAVPGVEICSPGNSRCRKPVGLLERSVADPRSSANVGCHVRGMQLF